MRMGENVLLSARARLSSMVQVIKCSYRQKHQIEILQYARNLYVQNYTIKELPLPLLVESLFVKGIGGPTYDPSR